MTANVSAQEMFTGIPDPLGPNNEDRSNNRERIYPPAEYLHLLPFGGSIRVFSWLDCNQEEARALTLLSEIAELDEYPYRMDLSPRVLESLRERNWNVYVFALVLGENMVGLIPARVRSDAPYGEPGNLSAVVPPEPWIMPSYRYKGLARMLAATAHEWLERVNVMIEPWSLSGTPERLN